MVAACCSGKGLLWPQSGQRGEGGKGKALSLSLSERKKALSSS